MSDKTIAQKLFLKEGYSVLLVNPPPGYVTLLGELPPRATLLTQPAGLVDLILLFVTSRKELEEQLPNLKPSLTPKGLLWIAFPKGTSKIKTDINRDSINAYAHSIGLQGVAIIAIDEVWSALRLKII